jgi:hypothetical protein
MIVVAHAPGFVSAGDSPERGHNDYLPASTRDLTDFYLPALAESERVAIFSTMEIKHLLRWAYMERGGSKTCLEVEWKGYGSSVHENRQRFNEWLATTQCDTVVFIDVPPGSYLHEMTSQNAVFAKQLPELLTSQTVFRETHRRFFGMYGCQVTIYARRIPHLQPAADS